MADAPKVMTKGERTELLSLIRKREKVLKTAAEDRCATLLAEFEQQMASIYDWNDDTTWSRVKKEAEDAILAANEEIWKRCDALKIPREFAPGIQMFWHGRGQNGLKGSAGGTATGRQGADRRRVRFSITVPQGADRKSEQSARAIWRALFLSVKAKLVSVESKIETFEEAFLAHIVMPDGKTVAQHTGQAIADAYAEGRMNRPLLLEGPR